MPPDELQGYAEMAADGRWTRIHPRESMFEFSAENYRSRSRADLDRDAYGEGFMDGLLDV